jgi:hypothetical protein
VSVPGTDRATGCAPWCIGRAHHLATGSDCCVSADLELADGVHGWLTLVPGGQPQLVVGTGRGRPDADGLRALQDRLVGLPLPASMADLG